MSLKIEHLNIADKATLAYNATVAALLLAFSWRVPFWYLEILQNLGAVALILLVIPRIAFQTQTWVRLARYLYPMVLFIAAYEQTGRINRLLFSELLDPWFQQIEFRLFACQPSLTFAKALPHTWLSEVMHLSYFSFYLVIPALGIILFYKKQWRELVDYVFCAGNTFYVCYLIFIFLPVEGATWFRAGGFENAGLITRAVRAFYSSFELPGAAFPSSHVAVATVVASYSFKYVPKTAWMFSLICVGVAFSTVYCRYHYVIDVISGLFVAIVMLPLCAYGRKQLEKSENSGRS